MSAQAWAACLIGLVAAAYLVWRWRRRRATGNCCGEPECPAAKQTLRRLDR